MACTRLLPLLFGLSFSWPSYAADGAAQRQPNEIVSYQDVMQWMLALIIVLAIFGVLAWALRKAGHFSLEHKGQLRVLSGLSLGVREKLVLVKVGEKQLLLGVTPGRVEKLMELEGDARLFQDQLGQGERGAFAKKLQQVLQGKVDE